MGKIIDAQNILKDLGLPQKQQNEISALTLLVLSQISESKPWEEASAIPLRIHDILSKIQQTFGKTYAENSRETFRKQVIYQFTQAGIIIKNLENPDLPTNSPNTNYTLSTIALNTIKKYNTSQWSQAVQEFQQQKGKLIDKYNKKRTQTKIPLKLPDGREFLLSPGKHNILQAAIIQEFAPRFAANSELLYLGDTSEKLLIIESKKLENLNIPVTSHDKLPDVVLYQESKKWLFLIEAVTSHGPVSSTRHFELENILHSCNLGKIYVTAFPDLKTFRRYVNDIAWETEVWISEIPDHLIHFNGDKFLGPHKN